MNARSRASKAFASTAVLVTMLLVLGLGNSAASAASVAAGEQLRPAAAHAAGSEPGRNAQLMAPECQLERAPMRCESSSGSAQHCACGLATVAARTTVLSLVLPAERASRPPAHWFGLTAK